MMDVDQWCRPCSCGNGRKLEMRQLDILAIRVHVKSMHAKTWTELHLEDLRSGGGGGGARFPWGSSGWV